MKILDKHILKEITIPILLSLYLLVFLFLVADLFDHLDEIIRNNTTLKDLIIYYLYLTPFAFAQTVSWATLLGITYLFTTFKRHGEIIAMKACGLKMTQIAAPIFFLGLLLSVVTFFVDEHVVPYTLTIAQNIKKEKIDMKPQQIKINTINNTALLSHNRQYFIKRFDVENSQLEDIRIHILDESNLVQRKIVAQRGKWLNGVWVLNDVAIYQLDTKGHIVGEPEVAVSKSFPEFIEKPRDFIEASIDSTLLSSKKLEAHIKRLKDNGLSVTDELAAFHHKRAFPWQSLVIMFITIPFLGRTGNVRESLAKKILLCLICVLSYHVFSAVFLALGKSGILFPFVSAWLASFLFTVGGICFFEKANY